MTAPRFTVDIRDADLRKIGVAGQYTAMSCTPRFNAVGSWSLVLPADSLAARLLAVPGRGIRILRRGSSTPVMTGPALNLAEGNDGRAEPQLTFTGACDNLWLARRLALPDPTVDADTYTDEYDVRSGPAEDAMHAYVNANAGPGALADRQVLTLGASAGRGVNAAFSARFQPLLVLLQTLAATSGLGFQVQQEGTQLVFRTYAPQDRSRLVRFDTRTKSLGPYAYSLAAPTATTAYVGDGQPGAGRSFTRFTDAASEADWAARSEVFVDHASSTDPLEIAQAGQKALQDGGPQSQVSFTPRDTPQRRYGEDYGLGDSVTVRVALGDVVDVVREVVITSTKDDGVQIRPTVGGEQAADPASNSAYYKVLRKLADRIGDVQRRY